MNSYYGVLSPESTPRELRHRELARRAAAEGFVLLKNEGGALPLQNKRIALYGMGARKTVKGGLGSGSVEERYSVTIEEGLKNAGYEITTQRWLDDYDAEYAQTYRVYHDMVEEKVAGLTNPMEIIPLAHSYVYRYPSGRVVDRQDIEESGTDTALYVLMRQAGECNDRRLEPGDYYITDIERENLRILAEAYPHLILIINVGGLIDMGFLDEIEGIDGVVLFVQGGEEGGNALADVLSGKANFNGRLADTIPLRYEDIPSGDTFSYLDGNLEDEYYREGIYMGYRYFDTFDKEVRYPFGFGLSYTEFALRPGTPVQKGAWVELPVTVTNTGKVSGREVVQAYVSAPRGSFAKEAQRLAAFAKTPELAPGAVCKVTLRVRLEDCASYDTATSRWVMEAGDYLLRVGRHSRDLTAAAVLRMPRTQVLVQCQPCCTPPAELEELALPENIPAFAAAGALVVEINTECLPVRTVAYGDPEAEESPLVRRTLDRLTPAQQAELLRGGELQRVPAGAHEIHGAGGKTSTALLQEGIPNLVMADGPAGVNIVNRVCITPDGTPKAVDIPERYNWGALAASLKARMCKDDGSDGVVVHRYATAWPVELLLAQTWDVDLLRAVGDAVGTEMEEFGVSVWLAPGMNLHRNPLGGRCFEYYSEDPFLTGTLAAALVNGVQSHPGCAACVKHFCCNDSEDNRNGISANVSERALRELYLKGFEIVVRDAAPRTLMSSYNRINRVYTANNHDLLTHILRCEWGFEGLVMTDWNSCNERAGNPEDCAPAGNDLVMPGSAYDLAQILQAIETGSLSAETLRRSAARVLALLEYSGRLK